MSNTPKADALREVVIEQYKENELTGNGMGNILAALADIEELERERDEARDLADRLAGILRLYYANDTIAHNAGVTDALTAWKEARNDNHRH